MSLARFTIHPEVIDWVLNNATQESLTEDIRHDLHSWKKGTKLPTFKQIENLSKKLHIPFGYFFLKGRPREELRLLEYRTVDSLQLINPSRNLIDTVNQMESIQDWMRNYLIETGFEELFFVSSSRNEKNPAFVAQNMRKAFEISEFWQKEVKTKNEAFNFFKEKLQAVGVLIMQNGVVGNNNKRTLRVEEFRAFALVDSYAPLIFINTRDTDSGKLFSLLHEAAHIWIGSDSLYNAVNSNRHSKSEFVNSDEVLCNAVAAEILMPQKIFIDIWSKSSHFRNLSEKLEVVAKQFKCGEVPVARRALDNGFIDKDDYDLVVKEAIKNQSLRGKGGGGDFYNVQLTRIDNRFLLSLDNHVQEGRMLHTDAYRLTKTKGKTFNNLVDKARGRQYV